ncbi:MAG TPA: DUF2116 family Zn-ribbon domain-containing protein [Sphingobacterium sp.]|nr:DUF2116 family Zn-ribbon domain-containing protein [Sphingobacterium sp.]
MTPHVKTCLDCGQKLIGRSDKKFCDDACRSHYNNNKQRAELKIIRKINAILKSNRKILKKQNPSGKTKVQKKILQKEGFNFEYFTHQYITAKGNTYYFCYDYGYLFLPYNKVLIVKKEE